MIIGSILVKGVLMLIPSYVVISRPLKMYLFTGIQ